MEAKEAAAEELRRAIEEADEEQGGEDGLLFEGKSEKGKLTAASIKARLKEIKTDPEAADEREALEKCLRLIEDEAEASKAAKEARLALDVKTAAKYRALTETEIKTLIVEDKWMATLERDIHGELDRVSQTLAGRIKLLTERYAAPLPQLEEEAENARRPRRGTSQKDGLRMASGRAESRRGIRWTPPFPFCRCPSTWKPSRS